VGEDTEQLRRNIEATREDIARDVDALTYKASPRRVVSDKVEGAKSGLSGLKDKVFGGASDTTSDLSGRASSVASSAQDRASSALGSAQETVGSAASTVSSAVSDAPTKARQQTQGNPLAAGLIAFGVGWLASTVIPATRQETEAARRAVETAQEHKDTVLGEAKQAASQVGEALKEPAQEAVESVRSTASEGAQQVKEQGQSSAQSVKETAQSGSGSGAGSSSSVGYSGVTTPAYEESVAPVGETYPGNSRRDSDPGI
jgi:gas vesicle protein